MEKLGVTASELFVNNPYRVLGLPVNATAGEVEDRYETLIAMCQQGTINDFTSPFDMPHLPTVKRTIDDIAVAKDKVLSNGYRCFAFSDSVYAYDPSQTDINIHIDNIDCYDCFLSCYMWLIIHDKNIMFKSLWFKLAKYIDMLICSDPTEWMMLFDSRYPIDVYYNDIDTIKAFYSTFCEIILLPLKELVKGSMECQSAVEVLSVRMFEDLGTEDDDIQTLTEKAEEASKNTKKSGSRNPVMKGISLTEEYLAAQRSANDEDDEVEGESISLVDNLDENNIYNETLIQMLKANKARNQVIKELNTDVTFGSGNLGKEKDAHLSMQAVNTNAMDEKRLRSPYALDGKEMTLEEKYADVNINDMLNPTLPYSSVRDVFSGAENTVFDDHASAQRSGQKLFVILLILFIIGVGVYFGYTYWDEISEFINDKLFTK